jgi:chromosome segregation ATPase
MHSQQRAPEQYSKTAVKVMSAQRLKNNDLQNRIAEMNIELEQLKEENKTLKRVHHREEIALKKFEAQDNDIAQIVKNHMNESNALKEVVKKIKNENRKITGSLIEKDEEIRALKKKQEEFKQILNDKKLLDSVELAKKLDQANNSLSEYKKKIEVCVELF